MNDKELRWLSVCDIVYYFGQKRHFIVINAKGEFSALSWWCVNNQTRKSSGYCLLQSFLFKFPSISFVEVLYFVVGM